MSEMVEKVARAMHDATMRERRILAALLPSGPAQQTLASSWDDKTEALKELAMVEARAAVAAMRDPSGINISAVYSAIDKASPNNTIGPSEAVLVYQAMIDEALK